MTNTKEDYPKNIYTNLKNILSGSYVEILLNEFQQNPEERIQKLAELDLLEENLPEENYIYDPSLGVRKYYYFDDMGIESEVQQTFDDLYISKIQQENAAIYNFLENIILNATTYDGLAIKMKFYLSEVETLSFDPTDKNWKPLTEKSLNFIDDVIQSLKIYITSKIRLRDDQEIQPSTTIPTIIKNQTPGVIVSSWAKRNPVKIRRLYKDLSEEFIQEGTNKFQIFFRILSGDEPPSSGERIKWKNQRALKYFIQQLGSLRLSSHTKEKAEQVFTFPMKKWELIKACFVKPDGSEFKYVSTDKALARDQQVKIKSMLDRLNL